MKPADICIAVLVAVIWGLGFVASRLALDEFSPELMTTLRFSIAALPCLFVRKPDVSWPLLIAISFTLFLGQFLAQAFAIAHGVPVGLSSRHRAEPGAVHHRPCRDHLSRDPDARCRALASPSATVGLLMICGTVGYDFSVGAFAIMMICADQLCDRQSPAAAGQRRADVRPVRLAVPDRGGAAVRARASSATDRRRPGTR